MYIFLVNTSPIFDRHSSSTNFFYPFYYLNFMNILEYAVLNLLRYFMNANLPS